MARGRGRRGRGGGGVDYDQFYDNMYALQTMMPQGVLGNQFIFFGSEAGLIARVNSLTEAQLQSIKEARITIMGSKIKASSTAVTALIIFLGILLIFPLFFLCCQWYKRCTMPSFGVSKKSYEVIQKLVSNSPQLNIMMLTVFDNQLGKEKFGIFQNIVSMGRLRGFTLINSALPFGNNQDQYSDFQDNASKFRAKCQQNGIQLQGTWYTSIII